MAATAKTKQSVQSQNARDRAWDELEAKYSQERAESDKAYDQNKAAFTRGQVSRGMQRSSYTGQTAAGYDKEKINAQNRSYENQIAAYQSAVDAIEQREAEERYRQQQLALQQAQMEQAQKQFEAQLAFNKEQAALNQQNTLWSQGFQQSQADLAQKNTEWSQNYQQQQADRSQGQWEQTFGYQQQQDALSQANWEKNFGLQQQQADLAQKSTEWSQNFQQQQADLAQKNTEWSQNYQQQQADRSQSQWEQTFGYQQTRDAITDAFNEKQFNAQQEQWKQEFDYQQKSDEQKMAYNYVATIVANGGSPSDELLAQAGLSRADANAMIKQVSGSSGNYVKKTTTPAAEETTVTDAGLQAGLSSSNSTTGGTVFNKNLSTILTNIESEQAKKNPDKLNAVKESVGESTTKKISELEKAFKNTKVPTKSQSLDNSLTKR